MRCSELPDRAQPRPSIYVADTTALHAIRLRLARNRNALRCDGRKRAAQKAAAREKRLAQEHFGELRIDFHTVGQPFGVYQMGDM
jgi:hypothetical protein